MAFVVCIGAPVGSLILTPSMVPFLRVLFYVLAVVQLALFGWLKIGDSVEQWVAIVVITASVAGGLLVNHHRSSATKKGEKGAVVLCVTSQAAPREDLVPAGQHTKARELEEESEQRGCAISQKGGQDSFTSKNGGTPSSSPRHAAPPSSSEKIVDIFTIL